MKSIAQQGNPADVFQPPLIFLLDENEKIEMEKHLASVLRM